MARAIALLCISIACISGCKKDEGGGGDKSMNPEYVKHLLTITATGPGTTTPSPGLHEYIVNATVSIKAQESAPSNILWSTGEQGSSISVKMDADKTVGVTFVPLLPNLRPVHNTSFDGSPLYSAYKCGNTITSTYDPPQIQVINDGNTTLTKSVKVEYGIWDRISGHPHYVLQTWTDFIHGSGQTSWGPGQILYVATQSYYLSCNPPAGKYYKYLRVDVGNAVEESDEGDNEIVSKFYFDLLHL